MIEAPHAFRLRHGRHSQPQQIYLVTAFTHLRQPFFQDFVRTRQLVGVLRQALSACVQRIKSLSAHNAPGRLWQKGFHDHAVRNEEDLPALARYIVSNPVRAGLVTRTGLYPHWDAVWV